jgi:ApbE family
MTVPLHTSSRTVTIGADFSVWDTPFRLVLTDPWQLRDAREVLRRELEALDHTARPRARVIRKLRPTGVRPPTPLPATSYPYGVTTAPANGVVHHRISEPTRLDVGRGRRKPLRLDLTPALSAIAAQRCAEAVAETSQCGVLVALGGDIGTSGLAPAGGWRIELPAAPEAVPTVLAVDGGALCTLGLPTGGPLRKLVVTATARPLQPVWRHVVVLGRSAPAANAAASGAMVRGAAAGGWLAELGMGARLVDVEGGWHEVGRWPGRAPTPLVWPARGGA